MTMLMSLNSFTRGFWEKASITISPDVSTYASSGTFLCNHEAACLYALRVAQFVCIGAC